MTVYFFKSPLVCLMLCTFIRILLLSADLVSFVQPKWSEGWNFVYFSGMKNWVNANENSCGEIVIRWKSQTINQKTGDGMYRQSGRIPSRSNASVKAVISHSRRGESIVIKLLLTHNDDRYSQVSKIAISRIITDMNVALNDGFINRMISSLKLKRKRQKHCAAATKHVTPF